MSERDSIMEILRTISLVVCGLVVVVILGNVFQYLNYTSQQGYDFLVGTGSFVARYSCSASVSLVNFLRRVRSNIYVYHPIYIIALILIGIPTIYHLVRRSQWRATTKQCEARLKKIRDVMKKEQSANKTMRERYEVLKQNITAAVSPCSQVIFNADDTVSLQHLFCHDYRKIQETLAIQRKQNLKLMQQIAVVKRTATWVMPTPEYIAAMESEKVQRLELTVERLRLSGHVLQTLLNEARNERDIALENQQNEQATEAAEKLRKELSEKCAELVKTKEAYKTLNSEERALGKELSDKKGELANIREVYNTLEAEKLTLVKDLNKTKKQVELASQEKLDLERALESKTREVDGSKKPESPSQERTSSANTEAKSAQHDLEAAHKVIEDLRSRLADKEQGLNECHDEVKALKASQQVVVAAPSPAPASDSQAIRDELQRVKTENLNLRETLQAARDQYGNEIAAAKAETDKWYQASQITTGADVRGHSDYQNLLTQAQAVETKGNELEKQVMQLTEQLKAAPTPEDIQAAEERHANLKSQYDAATSALDTKDQQIREAYEKLKQTQEDTEEVVKFKDQDIADRNRLIRDQNTIIAERDQQIKDQNITIESLAGSLSDSESDDNKKPKRDQKDSDTPLLDTGALVKNLNSEIEELRTQSKQKDATIAERGIKMRQYAQTILSQEVTTKAAEAERDRIKAELALNESKAEELDEIERYISMYNVPGIDHNLETSKLVDVLLSRAQDAQMTYAVLDKAKFVDPRNGDRITQHVEFLIREHDRHRFGAASMYNVVVGIERELERRFGSKPQGSVVGALVVERVRRLINEMKALESEKEKAEGEKEQKDKTGGDETMKG